MGIVLHDIGVLKLERRLAVASIRKVIILFPTFKFIVGVFSVKKSTLQWWQHPLITWKYFEGLREISPVKYFSDSFMLPELKNNNKRMFGF